MQSTTWYEWIIDHPWMIELVLALFLLFLLNVILKNILNRTKKMAKLDESDWRFHLDYAAITPARVLLWILLIAFLMDLIAREFKGGLYFSYVSPLRNAAIIICLAWFLLRWRRAFHVVISHRSDRNGKKGKLVIDPLTAEVIGKVFTVMVVFITLLIVLQIFGLNVVPLVTFGGISAATLGISGKDAIANFFGGFMIYLTRPFMVGDFIELPQRKIAGNVEEIGWYLTSIRDVQKKPVYIPNSVFSTEPLINQSRMTHRRIEEVIGVRRTDLEKIPAIIDQIRTLFERHSSIDHHQSVQVFLQRFTDSSVQIEINAYVLCTRYEDFMYVKQEILTQIGRVVVNAGAELSYPTMRVQLREEKL